MIPEVLKQIESQMQQSLDETRLKFKNSTNKGSDLENVLRDFLRSYLPRNKSVGHGEIIDSFGHRSPQSDVVIVFDDHPYTFTENTPGIFLIEGVGAIGEVKTVLTSDELRKTIYSSQKTKKLKRKLSKGSKLTIPVGFDQRFLNVPPIFLFAFESQISMKKICEILNEQTYNRENLLHGTNFIDGVFILNQGAILNFQPNGGFITRSKQGERLTGWIPFEGDSLRPLLEWLYATMYQMEHTQPYIWHYTGLQTND